MRPLIDLTLGVAGAVVLFLAILRFLPGRGPWGGMVLQAAVAGEPGGIRPLSISSAQAPVQENDLIGSSAVAATGLYPSGQVTINGRRYEARVAVGALDVGAKLVVTGISEFGLIVEQATEEVKS
jgi:membrane-bound serine protease (ClpP class)